MVEIYEALACSFVTMLKQKIGVILINYHDYAERFLIDVRDSLRLQTYAHEKFCVYIIDNDSSVEARSYISQMYPEACLLASSGNGWGHANNIGMKQAFHDGCEAVVLLNMDTVASSDWLECLVRDAYTDDTIGIAQSKILLWNKDVSIRRINSKGNILHFLGFGYCDGYGKVDDAEQGMLDIGYASGASMLIKKEVIDDIQYCDEKYFMYHDDMEISIRAKLRKWRIVCVTSSIIFHKYEFLRSIKSAYYMERNRYLFLVTMYRPKTLFLIFPVLFMVECAMILYAIRGKWFRSKLRTILYFLSLFEWREIMITRQKIQSSRMLTDRELLRNAQAEIIFQEIDSPFLRLVGNPLMKWYFNIIQKYI